MKGQDPNEPVAGIIGDAVDELKRLSQLTGLSETDIFNKAIPLYGFLHDELTRGGVIRLTRRNGQTLLIELH